MSVGWDRVGGWIARYDARHPGTMWRLETGRLVAESDDGTVVDIPVPFSSDAGLLGPADVVAHLQRPWQLGVVLVRRGGFAVAHLVGPELVASKVSKRHVQGRTKAGGWSQQRFANRRSNQAKAAFDAAADHVVQILLPVVGRLVQVSVGGDRQALASVWEHPRLTPLRQVRQVWLGSVADPTRAVLDQAIQRARSVRIDITDPSQVVG